MAETENTSIINMVETENTSTPSEKTQLINLRGLNTFLEESTKIFEPTLPEGTDGQVLKLSEGKPSWGTDNTPTTFTWTEGTEAGPTGTLSGDGMTSVNFAAIPSASEAASGVVTTGAQTFAGTKTFNDTISGSIDGNAATSSRLKTAVSLTTTDGTNTSGAVSFDGSEAISIKLPTTIAATFSGDLTGNVSGNATTATTADKTAHSLSIKDSSLTSAVDSWDGSVDKILTIAGTSPITTTAEESKIVVTHDTKGPSTTGNTSKGDTSDQAPAFGETFKVTSATVDVYGHTTALADHTVTIPSSVASSAANGLMTSAHWTKLEGIAEGAEVNQNAFSNVKVGNAVVEADSKTDTLTLIAGNNVTIMPNVANDTITFASKDTTYSAGTDLELNETTFNHKNSGVTKGTYRSVTVNERGHIIAGTNPTTLGGYGITDAKITSGVITLGSNTITPLTADSVLNASKITSGTINVSRLPEFKAGNNVTITPDTANNKITFASSYVDTTYTFKEGATNGAFTVTPSGGTPQSVAIHGLGSAAYSESSAYLSSAGGVVSGATNFTDTTPSSDIATGAVTISGGLGVTGHIYAGAVHNAVWNDLVDCMEVPEDISLEYGYCYSWEGDNVIKSSRSSKNCIGIHSNTAGFVMGEKKTKTIQAAVAGFVLAYVDKLYPEGTPLTWGDDGVLTKCSSLKRILHPERVIATFYREEKKEKWHDLPVLGRHWVKVV